MALTMMLATGTALAATAKPPKPVKTMINVDSPTTIGDATLDAGTYDVKITPSAGDPSDLTVEFSRFRYVVNSSEGVSPEDDVVLTVQATAQDSGASAAKSSLIRSSENSLASGLAIRHDSTTYVFQPSTTHMVGAETVAGQ